MTTKKPVRMCITCRGRDEQGRLLRIGVRGGDVCIITGGIPAGRSAYVHPTIECVSKIGEVKKLSQAFRRPAQAFARESLNRLGYELRQRVGMTV